MSALAVSQKILGWRLFSRREEAPSIFVALVVYATLIAALVFLLIAVVAALVMRRIQRP